MSERAFWTMVGVIFTGALLGRLAYEVWRLL